MGGQLVCPRFVSVQIILRRIPLRPEQMTIIRATCRIPPHFLFILYGGVKPVELSRLKNQ